MVSRIDWTFFVSSSYSFSKLESSGKEEAVAGLGTPNGSGEEDSSSWVGGVTVSVGSSEKEEVPAGFGASNGFGDEASCSLTGGAGVLA